MKKYALFFLFSAGLAGQSFAGSLIDYKPPANVAAAAGIAPDVFLGSTQTFTGQNTFNRMVTIGREFVYTSSFPTIGNDGAANSRPSLIFVSPTFTNFDILCNDPDGCDIGFSFGTANQVIYVRQRGDITTGKLYMADVGPGSFQQDLEGNWVGNQAVAVGNYIGDQISLQYNAFSQDWVEQYRTLHIATGYTAQDNYVLRTSSTEAGYAPVPSLWISTESLTLFGGSTLVKSSGTLAASGTRAFTPAMFNYAGAAYAYNYIYPFGCTEVKNGAPVTVTIGLSALTSIPTSVSVENFSGAVSKDFLCWFLVKP